MSLNLINISQDPYKYDLKAYPFDSHLIDTIKDVIVGTLPFELITREMGESKCPECKTVHKGKVDLCTNQVDWYSEKRTPGWYGGDTTQHRGKKEVGETRRGIGWNEQYTYTITKSYKDNCKHTCSWDKHHEFEEQRRFFITIFEMVGGVNCGHYSPSDDSFGAAPLLARWGAYLNPSFVQRFNLMVTMQLFADSRHTNGALNQIAEKMNAAGHCLSF